MSFPVASAGKIPKKVLVDDHRQLGTRRVCNTANDLPDLLALNIQFMREGTCIFKGCFDTPVFVHPSKNLTLVSSSSPQTRLWNRV